MKKFLGYMIVMAILISPAMSLAAEFRAGDHPSVRENEIIANDLYIGGGSVTSAGKISGDLIVGGGNIVVSGDIGADVIAAGGDITILSNVGDDVRVGGGNIIIQGKVGGDLIVGGGQITIGGAGVAGDLTIGGGNIRIDAPVAGKVLIAGGNIYINAPIGGDIKIQAERVTLGSGAVISGNLTYKAEKELVIEPGAVVNGQIIFEPIEKRIDKAVLAAIFSAFVIWKFFALLACGLLFGLIFRRYARELVNLTVKRPLLELGRGAVVLVTLPIISILLLATMVGVPLGIIGLLGFAAMMIFSCIIAPIIVGSVVYRFFSKKDLEVSGKTITIGVFLYVLVGCLPFIGPLSEFLLMLIALGSIATLKWRIVKAWR